MSEPLTVLCVNGESDPAETGSFIEMHKLGVDITVIALWLGHESPATTHRYIEADLAIRRVLTLSRPRIAKITYEPAAISDAETESI